MAKGKHAAALFEVIHSGQQKPKPLLTTPRWWFKRAAKQSNLTSSLADPTEALLQSNVAMIDEPAPRADVPSASTDAPRAAGMDVAVDKERQQITFKISYTSAIIVSFALVVAMTLVYLVGKKMSHGPALAVASQTSEQLRAKPAHPDVLNVAPRNVPNQTQTQTPREPETGITSRTNDGTDPADPSAIANTAASTQRSINLNYAVIQSYPDEKSANEARDALQKSGVGCTIEQKLRGLNPTWFSVVGTQGFAHVSSDDYKAYLHKLDQISQQFAQNKRSFKAFQPMAYRWDRQVTSGMSQQ